MIDPEKLYKGDKRTLSKFITLTESQSLEHQLQAEELIETILPKTGKAIRIAITGTPGVGKSTLINKLGLHIISQGLKVAVLAIDPSSSIHGGSILGDKTRMTELSREEQAYIRPSPSSGTFGGLAHKTKEAMLLCEASNYDVILIETVGVGQSETHALELSDMFLVIQQPGTGDELQGIKKGIIEVADAVIINKAEEANMDLAQQSKMQFESAFSLTRNKQAWIPKVLLASAIHNKGIEEIWQLIDTFIKYQKSKDMFYTKRKKQDLIWFKSNLLQKLHRSLEKNENINQAIEKASIDILNNKANPITKSKIVFNNIQINYSSQDSHGN